jgi:hypothetical protein
MVRTWLRHDFTAWCSMVRRGDIHLPEALDTAAFETMQSSRAETAPDMLSLEAQLPDSAFKSEVQLQLARRGDPKWHSASRRGLTVTTVTRGLIINIVLGVSFGTMV